MKTFDVPFRSLCVSAMLLGVSCAFAQTPVDLSGIVYDQDNKPRVGVIVSLAADLLDTTGADGKWTIQGQIVPVKQTVVRSANLRWLGGDLVTQFDAPILVSADLFDAAGRRLANLPARMVLPGTQSVRLNLPAASGARWLRVRTGSTSTVLSAHSGVQAPSIALPAGLSRASGIVDQILSYSFQGQIVTEDQLPSLIQSGLLKWIQDYRVSAPITLDPRVKVDSVWAWFKGGSMAQPIRARMACDTINQLISGRVYTVKSQDPAAVYAFRTWINVYGNGNRLTAISDTIGFTTLFGDIAWTRGFSLGNAFPDGSIISADSVEAGNGLNLSLRLAYLDTASHRVKDSVIKAEWDLADGLGWRVSASLSPVATAKWNTAGIDTVKLRVMDKDSNVAVITKAIKVVNSGSALRLTSGPTDTTITPSDTVSFQLYARDTSGVAKVIWNYGDGKFDTTKTGSVHASKHAYPGPSVVLAGNDSTFALIVTVIDSLGGSTAQKLSSVKVSNVVLTGNVTGPNTGLVSTAYPFAVTVVPAGKKIAHAEWDLGDGQGWRTGSAMGYLAKWLKLGTYTVKVRLTDKDSNTVTLTAAAMVVTNPKAAISIVSITDPNLAFSTGMDTVITPSDTVTFMLTVSDPNGVAKVLWDFGDGKFDSTPAGSAQSIKHVYPDTSLVKADSYIWKTFIVSLKVIDSLGDTSIITRVANILQVNISPRIKITGALSGVADSVLSFGRSITTATTPTYYSKIVRHEWSTDGVTFGIGPADTLLRLPHLPTSNFMVYARVIDEDGNASKVDSICVIVYGQFIDSRDNQTYKYIKIGSQTWMAQNLNYNAIGSIWWDNLIQNDSSQALFGRQYSRASALGLPDSCNRVTTCDASIPQYAQGVCPSGWRVPRDTDWVMLATSVEVDPRVGSGKAGKFLKSRSGWLNSGGDIFGFRAVMDPSGFAVGRAGNWITKNRTTEPLSVFYPRTASISNSGDALWVGNAANSYSALRCIQGQP
jgi:uncharacterized protein (TIGR02145 family)